MLCMFRVSGIFGLAGSPPRGTVSRPFRGGIGAALIDEKVFTAKLLGGKPFCGGGVGRLLRIFAA